MSAQGHEGIIAGGRERILGSPNYVRRAQEIRERIEARYAEELVGASFVKRLALRSRMIREMRKELERLAPRHAFYLSKQHA